MEDTNVSTGGASEGSSSVGQSSPLGGGTGAGGVSEGITAGAGAGTGSTTPYELTPDTMVNYQGQPVKYGDLSKRIQADYTRKTQQAAAIQAQVARERQSIQAERARLEGIAASLVSRQQGQQGQGNNDPFLEELGKAEYIDGKTAVKLVQQLQQSGFAPIAAAIGERDKVITQMYQHIVRLSQQVNQMGSRFGNQDFDGKINKWLSDGGYPAEAADLAKEIYLAYEGDDLDNEFPQIFESRWNQIQLILDNQRKQKVEAARRSPMLPGRGGNGSAARPIGLKGNESPKAVADLLWDAMQAGDAT